jgi:hypothetical protein
MARLSATDKKELIRQVDQAEITLSTGETLRPEDDRAVRIRRDAREFLKKELQHVSSRAEADELVQSTFALMRSYDASASQFSRARLRTEHDSQVARGDLLRDMADGSSKTKSFELEDKSVLTITLDKKSANQWKATLRSSSDPTGEPVMIIKEGNAFRCAFQDGTSFELPVEFGRNIERDIAADFSPSRTPSVANGIIASEAAFEAASKSPTATVHKVPLKDNREVYVALGGSSSTEKKEAAIAFSQANGNVYVQVPASTGTYYVNGTGARVSLADIDGGYNIDQPNYTIRASSIPAAASVGASKGAAPRQTPTSTGTSSRRSSSSRVDTDSEGLPSIGRVNLGNDYSASSYERSVPAYSGKKSVTVETLKGVSTTILGQGVLTRTRSGGRSSSVDRGDSVKLSGEVIYMRASNSSTPLAYLVLEDGKTAVAAKFVKAVSAPASAPASASNTASTAAGPSSSPQSAPPKPQNAPDTPAQSGPPSGKLADPGVVASGSPGSTASAPTSAPPASTASASAPASAPLGSVPNPPRPGESGTYRASVDALVTSWAIPRDTTHRSVLASLTDRDIHEAWRTDEVRVVMTSEGARIWRDEKNYRIVTFADLQKTEFERVAPLALQEKAEDMELMLKSAVASDGNNTKFSTAYEAFSTAMARYSTGNDTEINKAMNEATNMFDEEFGGWGTWIKQQASFGTAHSAKEIMALSDASARRKMTYEWCRYVSHDTLKEGLLNTRFESITKLAGSEITANDLTVVEGMLGDFSNNLVVDNLERGILDPATVTDAAQQAVCQKFNAVLSAGRTPEQRKEAIEKFIANLRRKIVSGSEESEAKKYLRLNQQANYEVIRKQVQEKTGVDLNTIPTTSPENLGRNDKEKEAIHLRIESEKAIRAHVTSIFALTAIKAGIFDAAVEATMKADTLKNDPAAGLYGNIMGISSTFGISDSTFEIGVNAAAFVIPEIVGMIVGMGIGAGVMWGLRGVYAGMRGVSATRAAMGLGRMSALARYGRLSLEGATYGGTMYGGGLIAPNLLHGRQWNEGFDRNELFFSMGLGFFYPYIHALSPMGKAISGQGLMGKSVRFATNTFLDSVVVHGIGLGGDATLDIVLGEGEYYEKDFWQILTMMPLMRLGMNLSAGMRHKVMIGRGSSGEITATMLNPKNATFADEVSRSVEALRNAPEGTAVAFPGSTVTRKADGSYIVENAAGNKTPVAASMMPGKTGRDILKAVRANAPAELTPDMMASMAYSRVEAELARQIPDSVSLIGGYRVKLDNPAAAVADRRYTLMDSSGATLATGVEKSKLSGFIAIAQDPRNNIIAQLRAGLPEVGDATGVRVVVRNPDAPENMRVCDVYHKNIKIGENLLIDDVESRLGSIFASVDDATMDGIATVLQGQPAKLANSEGNLQLRIYTTPAGPRYQVKQGTLELNDLDDVVTKKLIDHGIPKKNDLEIKAILDPATPIATAPTGVQIHGEMFVKYDPAVPVGGRTYELVRREAAGDTVIATKTHAEMEVVLREGVDRLSTTPVDDFISSLRAAPTPGAAATHSNITVRPIAGGKYDIDILIPAPAGSPAGTPPTTQLYAQGMTLAEVRTILSGGSTRGVGAPTFLDPLRGTLAHNSVSYGNLTVTVEDATKPIANRTYKVECDGALFGRGMTLDQVDVYLTEARAVADIDSALGRLSPVGLGGAPIPRTARVAGVEVLQNPDGTFSFPGRTNASRADTIAELAARERAGNTLFGKDSPLLSNYIDRISQKLPKNGEVEIKLGSGAPVKIKRTGSNTFEVSGGNGPAAPDIADGIMTQSKIREYVAARGGIQANGVKYLEENAPAILEQSLRNIKHQTLRDMFGDGAQTLVAGIKNDKAKTAMNLLLGVTPWQGMKNLTSHFTSADGKGILGILYWALTGGRYTTGFWQTAKAAVGTQFAAAAITGGVNLGESLYNGE